MAMVKAVALAVLLALAPPAHAGTIADWGPVVTEASRRFGLPAAWIEQVILMESAGHTTLNGRPIVSRAGAMGLMQLMPGTWSAMRATLGLGGDPFDPHDNILAGTAYLRLMYDRFGYPAMFAAYNAGPGRVAAWRAGRRGLPSETAAYLASVTGVPLVRDGGSQKRAASVPGLFARLGQSSRDAPMAFAVPPSAPLFALVAAAR